MSGGWDDGCMVHMRKTYMQNRMVRYVVSCKLYIYIPFFENEKNKHGKLFLFFVWYITIYVYFHHANIIHSSGTILFLNGVVVSKTKLEFE